MAIDSKLQGTKVSYIEVDYNDVDDAIAEFYGLSSYECVAYEEWNNYEKHTFNLDGELSDVDKRKAIDLMLSKKPKNFHTKLYLDYMVSIGVIEKEKYLISVSW